VTLAGWESWNSSKAVHCELTEDISLVQAIGSDNYGLLSVY
jgi:hypothetical protein